MHRLQCVQYARTTFGSEPWRPRSQHDLETKSCPSHNFFIWSRINYFTEMITILRRRVACKIWVSFFKVKVTAWPCSKNVSGPSLCYLKSDFTTISQKWSPYWNDMSRATFWSLPWRPRSQHDLAAKTCPAHYFVIWSPMLKLLHRNDHHIESPCREQHLGRCLECQGHSMTLQQKRVRPIALLFKVGFYSFFTERIINGKKRSLW